MSVGHIHLNYLEAGNDSLSEQVKRLLIKGCRHIVFDAQKTQHLDTIAALSRDRFEDILLVGSAGLAHSLAGVMAQKPIPEIPADRPQIKRWLFICGSASQVLTEQALMLAQSTGWSQVIIDPGVLTADHTSTERKSLLTRLKTTWLTGNLILSIAPRLDTKIRVKPERLVQGLAEVVSFLLSLAAPDGLFLSGGDTAEKVLHKTNGSAILLREEILPGIMHGGIACGPLKGLPVFTKPGAFGQPDTLIKLLHSLTAGE